MSYRGDKMDRETWHALYVEHVLACNEILIKSEELKHYDTIYSIMNEAVEHLLNIGIEKHYFFGEVDMSDTMADILEKIDNAIEEVDDKILYEERRNFKKGGVLERLEKEFKK